LEKIMSPFHEFSAFAVLVMLGLSSPAQGQVTKEQAREALHKAVRFFREEAAASGSYV
jgi:hypothetical protein